jgi:DNA-binding PadR family transcriptional regulator
MESNYPDLFDQVLGSLVEDGLIEEETSGTVQLYRIRNHGRHWFTREQIFNTI